jgi:mannan endo-1,4-beta-mannosidase
MAILLCMGIWCATVYAGTLDPQGGFVTAEGTKLKLNGGDFYFSGVNSYSILYSESEAEEQFKILSDMGANVLRFWGFWNGGTNQDQLNENGNVIRTGTPDTDMYGRFVLQSRPGVYPEQAWRRMDYAIYLAHIYGIKLIIPLMNQWPEFGGIDTALDWVGMSIQNDAPPESDGHYGRENYIKQYRGLYWDSSDDPDFPNASKEVKQIYLDYVTHMLNRVNVYTGVVYKNDPAIMIWEIFNEPRFGPWNGDEDCVKVTEFIREASAHIKSIDRNHLVSTGEEGFMRPEDNSLGRETYPWRAGPGEGIDFLLTADLDDIDILSIHSWPFQWNLFESSEQNQTNDLSTTKEYSDPETHTMPQFEKFVREWIEEHVRIANEVGKPIYLGEFGYQILRAEKSNLELRDSIFQQTYDTAKSTNLSGATVFNILASHDVESAVFKVPEEDWTRKNTVLGLIDDKVVPHDLDYKFDVYCPEDVSTCDIIRDFSSFTAARVQNPDPLFVPPCLPPQAKCGEECVFLDSHPDHCGSCEEYCDDDETCAEGECLAIETASYNGETALDGSATGCTAAGVGRLSSDLFSIAFELLV